jgi:hypothetical protein
LRICSSETDRNEEISKAGTRKWLGTGLGVAALSAAVAYAQYRDIEKPDYTVLATDGAFELR